MSKPDDSVVTLKSIAKRFLHVMSYFSLPGYAWAALAISVVAGGVLEPAIPALLKPLLDSGFKTLQIPIWLIPAVIISLFMLRSSATFVSDVALAKIAQTGLQKLRSRMFESINSAELDLYRQQPATQLANTVVFEATNGAVLLLQSVTTLVKDSIAIAALFSYLTYLNWKLTLIVIFIFPAVAVAMRAIAARLYRLTKDSQAAIDQLAYVVEENVLAHKEIRLQAAQHQQKARFATVNALMYRIAMKSAIAGSAVSPITNIFGSVALAAVVTVAVIQSQSNALSAGGFVSFVTAMLLLIAPIKHLSEVTSTVTRGLVAAERAIALVEKVNAETTGSYQVERSAGRISFQQVGLQYPNSKTEALSGITLSIQGGQFIALVGPSGSGKTSVINILTRFVEYSSGRVTLDDVELRDWDLHSLRRQFALVSQNVVLLDDTLLGNVALGQPIDRERAMRCIEAACLADLIRSLPAGMDSKLGHNAVTLSGGERQRVAIARALYKDTPILILDEVTSALDTDTENLVQIALRTAMVGRTTIAIAHRLSTIEDADSIVVMCEGAVLQQGKHHELLARPGVYRNSKISTASVQVV